MADEQTFIYRINAGDVIDYVSGEWMEFAFENWDAAAARAVPGTPLWDHLTCPSTRELYRGIVRRVRERGEPVTFRYRCDAPDMRRHMRMEVVPLEGGAVEFRSSIERQERREHLALLDVNAPRTDEMLVICSWCKKVKAADWLETEEAVRRLGLFLASAVPQLSHGVCPECREKVFRLIEGDSGSDGSDRSD